MTELESVKSNLNRSMYGTRVRAFMRNIDLLFFFPTYTIAEKLNRIELYYMLFVVPIF
jgi:hypothetical protein